MRKLYIWISETAWPCASQESLTLEIKQSDSVKKCTFGYDSTTSESICEQINEQLEGVTAIHHGKNGPLFIGSNEPFTIMDSSNSSLDFRQIEEGL